MLGERIRSLRTASRLRVAEIASACDVTVQAVYQWESDPKRGPSRDVLPRLAAALGVTVDALLSDEHVNQPSDWSADMPAPGVAS